jgi:hypothetical protein
VLGQEQVPPVRVLRRNQVEATLETYGQRLWQYQIASRDGHVIPHQSSPYQPRPLVVLLGTSGLLH